MTSSRLPSAIHQALLISLLAGTLFIPLGKTDGVVYAADTEARAKADAVVRNAQTPLQKVSAYLERSFLVDGMAAPTNSDWQAAVNDIDEALKQVAIFEAQGNKKVTAKADLYYRKGSLLSKMTPLVRAQQGAIKAFDEAEAAGYAALYEKVEGRGANLWTRRGIAKRKLYDLTGALKDFGVAIERDSTNLDAWTKRADTQFELGDYEGAKADWKQAQTLKPTLGEAPYDPDLVPFNKAVAGAPRSAAPLIARARFRVKLAKEAGLGTNSSDFLDAVLKDDQPAKPAKRQGEPLELMTVALEDIERATIVEPNSSSAWLEAGRVRNQFLSVKSWKSLADFNEEAPLRNFRRAIEADPKNAAAWFELGKVQFQRVQADTMPVMSDTQEQWMAKKAVKLEDAIANMSRAIYLKPSSSGEAHFFRAYAERYKPKVNTHAVAVDYSAAIAQKMSALDDNPDALGAAPSDLADAQYMLGRIAVEEKRYKDALTAFEAALVLNPNELSSRLEVGKLRTLRGEYDLAIAALNVVLKARPRNSEALFYRGMARDGKKETEAAKADLAQAVDLNGKWSAQLAGTRYAAQNPQPNVALAPPPLVGDPPHGLKGTALEHKEAGNALNAKKDTDGALAEYCIALRLDPNFADAYHNRGRLYADRRQYDLALADYARTIQIDPKHKLAYLNRAFVWRALGEGAKERADFDRAIECAVTPETKAQAYAQRANTRFKAGEKAEAIADAKQATALMPQSAAAWDVLASLQQQAESYKEAKESWGQLLKLDAADVVAQINLALCLAYLGDGNSEAVFTKALTRLKPDEVKRTAGAINVGLQRNPNSQWFLKLKSIVDQAARPQ